MALLPVQRMQVRLYLGWSERFHQTDSRLEQALNALDGPQSVDAEAYVVDTLCKLQNIDSRLTDALSRLSVVKIDNIEISQREIPMIRNEGRRLAGRIASLLGVEVRHDVFSGGGPQDFATYAGMFPAGGGNLPPL